MLRKEEILRQCGEWAKEAPSTKNNNGACTVGVNGLRKDMERLASLIQVQFDQAGLGQAGNKKGCAIA